MNRVLCSWDNGTLYQKYVSKGLKGMRRVRGRMPYREWEYKYGRDEDVSKELLKKWAYLNSEFIDNVEELVEYISSWSLASDRCWDMNRYEKYMDSNLYRMPPRTRKMK